jgi:mxaA protein
VVVFASCSLRTNAATSATAAIATGAATASTAAVATAPAASAAAPAPTPPASAAAPAPTAAAAPAASIPTPLVQQPRPFGYVLGDTLTQRILLESQGRNFDPAALPPAERASLWFARRSARIEPAEDGRRWLLIDDQLINAPQALMTVTLPSITLKSKVSNDALSVSAWPVSISPLTPRVAFAQGGLQELRPDHPAPTLPTGALRRQLEIWSGAFALTVVVWLAWLLARSVRATANQPFARALRAIRRSGDDSAAAWLALHRAFDATAGRALQLSTLPALFKQAPHFAPQRAAIEQFYAESSQHFFGTGASSPPETQSGAASLRGLCTTLRRIEKQHEQ